MSLMAIRVAWESFESLMIVGCLALGVLDRLQDHLLSTVQFGHDLASLVHNSWKMTKAESVRASHRHISMASMVLNR